MCRRTDGEHGGHDKERSCKAHPSTVRRKQHKPIDSFQKHRPTGDFVLSGHAEELSLHATAHSLELPVPLLVLHLMSFNLVWIRNQQKSTALPPSWEM